MSGAAMIGGLAARTPGSWTAKFKRRAGAPPVKLTAIQRANLIARHANFYETVAGVNNRVGGHDLGRTERRARLHRQRRLPRLAGERHASAIFGDLASAHKVPRTDAGMVTIKDAMTGSLERGIVNGVVAELSADQPEGPSPRVNVPAVICDGRPRAPYGRSCAKKSFSRAGAPGTSWHGRSAGGSRGRVAGQPGHPVIFTRQA